MRGEGRWRWPRWGLCRWLLLSLTKQTDSHDRPATIGAQIRISEGLLTKTVLGAGDGPAAGGAGVL